MEPHAIPRQITSFEFKLIGFLTLKQFIFLIVFTAIGVILYLGFPVPILNILFAGCAIALGGALAFLPVNERPLDVWIKNFFSRLLQPSQYYYQKKDEAPDFLKGMYILSNQQTVATHIDARQKLSGYTTKTQPLTNEVAQKNEIHQLIASNANSKTTVVMTPVPLVPQAAQIQPQAPVQNPVVQPISQPVIQTAAAAIAIPLVKQTQQSTPYLGGVIKNNKGMPLQNIVMYIKDQNGKTLRILKSNTVGQFATYHPLEPGEYTLESKDIAQKYFFDTMKLTITKSNPDPLTIVSKEIL